MSDYVYLVLRDMGPHSYPAVMSVFRTRKGADEEVEALNRAAGSKPYWAASVKVTQR